MKKLILLLNLCGIIYAFCYSGMYATVIPQPDKIVQHKGFFDLGPGTTITITSGMMIDNAAFLIKETHQRYNLLLSRKSSSERTNQITLEENSFLPPEGYQIEITPKEINCRAATSTGMFYAMQTLMQIISTREGKLGIPVMSIDDTPRYQWRGIMLDVSNHFFDKKTIKELLDVMAHLKLNRFHWHLTDESGWRIEIKKYPKLTEIGAKGNKSNSKASHAFYTQADIREIIAYAQERHIMVIPEINIPGNASAMIRAYPQLSAGETKQHKASTLNPAKEFTYELIDHVLTEISDLFPSPYIHIGGGEIHKQAWSADPAIRQFIKEKKLKDESGLEHYFIRRICDIVHKKGKTMIGWDEVANAGISNDKALIMWWRQDKPDQLAMALNNGFQVIMSPLIPCFFDLVQDKTHKIGRQYNNRVNTLQSVYNFPESIHPLIEGREKTINGLQACVWTETIASVDRLHYMIFPRLAAIAENGWSKSTQKEYTGFEKRIKVFLKYLNEHGISYFNPFDKQSTPEPWGPTSPDVINNG